MCDVCGHYPTPLARARHEVLAYLLRLRLGEASFKLMTADIDTAQKHFDTKISALMEQWRESQINDAEFDRLFLKHVLEFKNNMDTLVLKWAALVR